MTATTKQTIEVDVPVGWLAKEFAAIPKNSDALPYLGANGTVKEWLGNSGSIERYVLLTRDPSYINTSTIEYRVEVYRQWLLGKVVQTDCGNGSWCLCGEPQFPKWGWDEVTYRVKPEATESGCERGIKMEWFR